MALALQKRAKRVIRHRRVRARVKGSAARPRVAVFRSNKHIYVQLIDDEKAQTILALGDQGLSKKEMVDRKKSEVAHLVGQKLGELARGQGISSLVFDRGGFAYHGRVRSVAEGLREAGIKL